MTESSKECIYYQYPSPSHYVSQHWYNPCKETNFTGKGKETVYLSGKTTDRRESSNYENTSDHIRKRGKLFRSPNLLLIHSIFWKILSKEKKK